MTEQVSMGQGRERHVVRDTTTSKTQDSTTKDSCEEPHWRMVTRSYNARDKLCVRHLPDQNYLGYSIHTFTVTED